MGVGDSVHRARIIVGAVSARSEGSGCQCISREVHDDSLNLTRCTVSTL